MRNLWEKENKIRNHIDTMLQTKHRLLKIHSPFLPYKGSSNLVRSCLCFISQLLLQLGMAKRQFCPIRISANLLQISRKPLLSFQGTRFLSPNSSFLEIRHNAVEELVLLQLWGRICGRVWDIDSQIEFHMAPALNSTGMKNKLKFA